MPVLMSLTVLASQDFAREYVRLSLLGVYNINDLTECSKVLPARTSYYSAPDQSIIDKWLSSTKQYPSITNAMMKGDLISGLASLLTGIFKIFWA